MAMAPVWTGAALVAELPVSVLVSVEVAVLERSLVIEAIADEMEDLSSPVAVFSTDDSDDSELLAMSDETDARSELMEDAMELVSDDALEIAAERLLVEVEVKVVVFVVLLSVMTEVMVSVVWATAREARARTAAATRMLAVW